MTQDGIAAALGISRAHAALELKRLRTSGKLEERMAHVAHARTRRKVYVLLPAGQEAARRMREHARARRVTITTPEGDRELSGADAIELLRASGTREAEAILQVLLKDRVEVAPRPPPAKKGGRPPPAFVGRVEERATLATWLGSDRRPVAVVLGVAGIGKSALVRHALEGRRPPAFVRRVYAHDDAHSLLASLADFLARHGRRRLRSTIARAAYDPAEATAVLKADLAGLVVAFDDLHACPPAEGLLRALVEDEPAFHVLVASRVRPSFYDRGDLARGRVLEIQLEGLDAAAAEDFLRSRGATFDDNAMREVYRATRGHPLALELFASSGLDAGADATERYILETVLEGLDDGSEALLRTLSVFRRPAPSSEDLGGTVSQVRRLLKAAILEHREDGYQVHDVVKEFFLGRMAAARRAQAEVRAAEYWEARGDALEAAHHRIEAEDPEAAAGLLRAGGAAFAEGARAGDLEATILRLPEPLRPRMLLAEARMFLGRFTEAKETFESIAEDGTADERLRARIGLGRIANRLGAYSEARRILAEAAQEAAGRGDVRLEAQALRALGGVERRTAELPAALEHLKRAVALLDDDPREMARALTDLGATLIALGDLAGAKEHLLSAAALTPKGSREEAAIQNNLAIVLSRQGVTVEAADAFERAADLALRTGEIRFAAHAFANAADNLLRLDATDRAEACAQRAISLAGAVGDPLALSTARANLGLIYSRRGDWQQAEVNLLTSVDLLKGFDNPYSLAARYDALARLYEAQGRGTEASPWRSRADEMRARLRTPPVAAEDVRRASDQTVK